MSRWLIAPLLLLAAAGKPDYSGRWLLNVEKSELGNSVKPPRYEMLVTHADPALTMKSTLILPAGGEQVKEFKVSVNGQTTERDWEGGGKVQTKARWRDGKIIFEQSLNGQLPVVEIWSLSADRKTLTSTRTMGNASGPVGSKMVFDRIALK